MSEFIDEKSSKAKGKRVSTLEIASIEDITPAPEPDPEEEEEGETDIATETEEPGTDTADDTEKKTEREQPESLEVEGVTMTFEKPTDTQLDLF